MLDIWSRADPEHLHKCRAEAIIAPLPCRKLDLIVDLLAREILHPDEAGERAERLGQSERATAAFRLRWQEVLRQPNGVPCGDGYLAMVALQ